MRPRGRDWRRQDIYEFREGRRGGSNGDPSLRWLREPIGYYRSYVNQKAKLIGGVHRDRSPPPPETFTPKFRGRVGRLWKVWGKPRVALHLYDPCTMVNGDSVSDFMARAVPEAEGISLKPVRTNVDLAPELDAATQIALQRSCADDIAFMQEIGLLHSSQAAQPDNH